MRPQPGVFLFCGLSVIINDKLVYKSCMGKFIAKIKQRTLLPVLGGIVLAFLLGMLVNYLVTSNSLIRLQAKYNFLAKRVLIENPNDILLNFSSLESQLETYTNTKLDKEQASVYFEYLPSGTSIGINEKEELVGASLLKTPLAINLFKASEEGKINLDTPITLKKEWLNSQYGELYKKGDGYQLTLRQAAEIMLKDSDNTAALMIYDSLAAIMPIDNKLLSFIDADYGVNKDSSVRLGAQSYSAILKCLYFACYTNRDSSQEILSYLARSSDSSRLKLYLTDNSLRVAHKIGTYDASGEISVQSDCGIFYVPNRNYLLCVMVKGDDPAASRAIGDISKIVNDFIVSK